MPFALPYYSPSKNAFTVLLNNFDFIAEVEVYLCELPMLAAQYEILCVLAPLDEYNLDLDEAREIILKVLQLAVEPWNTCIKCLVREAGSDGDIKEVIWRLVGTQT